ncbi:hypothetical protein PybrP1_005181 [[Pythium] brassicae (nom. inval.)]|nr:hypothetical protein PybrP1_005181 [[Pythium] brassicae (nom. inval.)]
MWLSTAWSCGAASATASALAASLRKPLSNTSSRVRRSSNVSSNALRRSRCDAASPRKRFASAALSAAAYIASTRAARCSTTPASSSSPRGFVASLPALRRFAAFAALALPVVLARLGAAATPFLPALPAALAANVVVRFTAPVVVLVKVRSARVSASRRQRGRPRRRSGRRGSRRLRVCVLLEPRGRSVDKRSADCKHVADLERGGGAGGDQRALGEQQRHVARRQRARQHGKHVDARRVIHRRLDGAIDLQPQRVAYDAALERHGVREAPLEKVVRARDLQLQRARVVEEAVLLEERIHALALRLDEHIRHVLAAAQRAHEHAPLQQLQEALVHHALLEAVRAHDVRHERRPRRGAEYAPDLCLLARHERVRVEHVVALLRAQNRAEAREHHVLHVVHSEAVLLRELADRRRACLLQQRVRVLHDGVQIAARDHLLAAVDDIVRGAATTAATARQLRHVALHVHAVDVQQLLQLADASTAAAERHEVPQFALDLRGREKLLACEGVHNLQTPELLQPG